MNHYEVQVGKVYRITRFMLEHVVCIWLYPTCSDTELVDVCLTKGMLFLVVSKEQGQIQILCPEGSGWLSTAVFNERVFSLELFN